MNMDNRELFNLEIKFPIYLMWYLVIYVKFKNNYWFTYQMKVICNYSLIMLSN